MSDDNMSNEKPAEYPINGILDLHTFAPSDVKSLVPEYLHACREKKIYTVRIIHGKGTGSLRRMVHALLKSISWVDDFHIGGHGSGSWGATIVHLEPEKKS